MDDEFLPSKALDLAATVTESMDIVLAMLLLTRRARVETISLAGSDLARIEFSWEAIEHSLAALAQPIRLLSEYKRDQKRDAKNQAASFWQALKNFALPPPKKK